MVSKSEGRSSISQLLRADSMPGANCNHGGGAQSSLVHGSADYGNPAATRCELKRLASDAGNERDDERRGHGGVLFAVSGNGVLSEVFPLGAPSFTKTYYRS